MNENSERDELFRNRIRLALRELNGPSNGFDSNASIEAELAGIDAAPLEDGEVERIMSQVHRSILEAASSREGMDVMQNQQPSRSASQSGHSHSTPGVRRRPQSGSAAIVAIVTTSLCLLTMYGLFQATNEKEPGNEPPAVGTELAHTDDPLKRSSHHFRYVAGLRPQATPPEKLTVGQTIRTADRERRRALLPDGSILYLNERSTAALTANRTVALHRGQLFVEVTPATISNQGPFVVETPDRSVTALGTKFAVSTDKENTEVLVTQGKVRISGVSKVVTGGQVAATSDKDSDVTIDAAPRASQALSWTRELIAAAETSIVPQSKQDGGSLIVVDPSGQEMKLSLRKFHVDAYIEDGFARTTIDQTYFNHTHSRQEGTFKFPLPPDASLSRLAMYVNGKLMEGGMVERDHGRNVFEQIMHTKRDPALLEWVDGSTFKMRVFPLEPRQEKRIVLSYTQRLPNDYNRTEYRFPAGHSLDQVRDWSTRVTVANGAGKTRWFSPTHLLKATDDGNNLILEGDLHNAVLDKDLVVELTSADSLGPDLSRKIEETVAFSSAQHDGFRYQMLRFRPDLQGELQRPRRNWVLLYESSGDRNPLLARVQLDVISTMLEHAEHDDTFSIISAATTSESFRIKPVRCSKKNIQKAVDWLENVHLVGALNLEEAFSKAKPLCRSDNDTILVHVGSANPVLGQRDQKKLLNALPVDAQYVGVGIGKRWSRSFMKSAAGRTGGHFTQINPDEKVSWRAFELLSTLNAPRLINLKVDSDRKDVRFLTFADTLAHGQEFSAITRVPVKSKPLQVITITGTLDGQPYTRTLPVTNVESQDDYLPRTWARLEIDRLVVSDATANKNAIIKLSKTMYVMSPFTSLLVLENEAMYEQFKVDRGRKDHWALYPAPETIKVVHEPGPIQPEAGQPIDILKRRLKEQVERRKIAQANLDQGKQDSRSPAEQAKLKSMLTQEEHNEEVLRNRLKLAEQIERQKSANIAKTVLYRCPPSITVPSAYVNAPTWRLKNFSYAAWNQPQFHMVQPGGLTPLGESQIRNHWGFQPANSSYFFDTQIDLNAVSSGLSRNREFDVWYTGQPLDHRWSTALKGLDGQGFGVVTPHLARQLERAYQIEFADAAFGTRLPGGSRPTVQSTTNNSQTFAVSGFEFTHQGLPRFAFEQNGDGYLPALLGLQESSAHLWGEQTVIRGDNLGWRDRYFGRNNTVDQVTMVEPSILMDLDFPVQAPISLDNRDFGEPHYIPMFAITILDEAGLIVAPNGRLTDTRTSPALSSYGRFIEGWYDDVERYGKAVIPNRYDSSGNHSRYGYIRGNTLDFGLDDLVQFQTLQSGFEAINGFPGKGFIHQNSVAANGLGFIPRSELNARLAAIRLVVPEQPLGITSSPGENIVQLPIQRPGILRNILSYAPGMQTSLADVLAVVESEGTANWQPERGTIDADALRLIEKSRRLGWERITFVSGSHNTESTLLCNGKGDLRLERRTVDGLLEQVVADGSSLQHLYPELGIGSSRPLSRFHRRALLKLTPWLLPPADELAIGCDIQKTGENTIGITRLENLNVNQKADLTLEVVFDTDGRVAECRLVKLSATSEPASQILLRQVFTRKGSIRILGKNGKLLTKVDLQRKPIAPPSDAPSTDGLVILPLPYRSADSYSLVLPAQPADNDSIDYSQLPEADAMKLVATHVANSDFDALWNVINQRFVVRDDARMGFAVLLSAAQTGNSQPIHEVASHNQGSSALGSFLIQHFDWWKNQDQNKEFVLPESASPFIRHLADAHNLYALWSSGRATQDRTESQVNNELDRAIELIRSYPSRQVAWALLNVVHQSIDETFSKQHLHLRLASEAASFESTPGLFVASRYARVLWLISAGKTDEARTLYRDYRRDTIAAGVTPPVSPEVRSAFKTVTGSSDEWSKLILESAQPLVEQQRSRELLQLALSCAIIAEHDTARQLLDKGIEGSNLNKRPDLLISGLRCLITIDDWQRAEDFARRLLNYRDAHQNASLWRTASQIAAALGDDDESLRRLEQAMRLEFSSLPDMVDVGSLRAEYNRLFDRFTSYSEKTLTDGKLLPGDFAERLTQAADAWRSIDPDPTQSCQRAAKLLQLIGLNDDAWEYWTTPLVNTANSSTAWASLATALTETSQIHRASQAWTEAFAAEPTNPELLWNHAELLRNHNQPKRAKELLTQIANGKWQPRFTSYKSKAKSLLQKL